MHRLHEVERIELRAQQRTEQDLGGRAQARLVTLQELGQCRFVPLTDASQDRLQGFGRLAGWHEDSMLVSQVGFSKWGKALAPLL